MGEVIRLDGTEQDVQEEVQATFISRAEQVIEFLNSKTGKKFHTRNPRGNPTSNADVIMARIREGYSVADCKSVIAAKCREWLHDEVMFRYLTPETLFRRRNFEKYIGFLGGAEDAQ